MSGLSSDFTLCYFFYFYSFQKIFQNVMLFLYVVCIFVIIKILIFYIIIWITLITWYLSWWLGGKEFTFQCRRLRRCGFDPWVGKIPWRKKWESTPVFLPAKSHGQRSLAGYSPWGCKRIRYDFVIEQQYYFQLCILKIQEEKKKLCPLFLYHMRYNLFFFLGLTRWLSGEESTCQCRRCGRLRFDPWVGKIPWSRKW